jgi:hypothetical protein
MSVRIQDDGASYPAAGSYLDCDYSNNTGVFSSLLAMRDYIVMKPDDSVVFDVRDNDYSGACGRGALAALDTIAGSGLKHGVLTFNPADSTYKYKPAAGFRGVDSVAYYIKCGVDSSAAKVYILVQKPLSLQYVACPGASVTVGFNPATGVSYYWYDAETGAVVSSGNPANTLTIPKDNSPSQIWWVEPRHGSIVFPRYQVKLELSSYCGSPTPTGCSETGTLIYREDFGGNDVSDPQYSSTPLAPGLIDLVFCPNGMCTEPTYGYCFAKTVTSEHNNLIIIGGGDDHTFWNDKTRGYFMSIDPAVNNMNYKVYGSIIENLCTGMNLNFTLWAYDWHQGNAGEARPKIEMLIRDANTLDTIVTSGILTLHRETPTQNHVVWRQYGFDFTVPVGIESVLFTIVNKEVNHQGNDWFLDDIEIRFCAPPVNTNIVNNDTVVCYGNSVDITGTYVEDCTFGDELAYIWEFRQKDSVSWKQLATGTETVDCDNSAPASRTLTTTLPLASVTKADEGYYRLLVSSPANIGSVNCRAVSDSVYVHVIDNYVAPDIRIQVCPSANRQIQLSSFADSTDYNRIHWETITSYAPNVTDPAKGLISGAFTKNATYKYKYTVEPPEHSGCGSTSAVAYIKTLDNRVLGKTDTVAICCKELETSKYVQINSIFGLELGGTFDYSIPVNPDNTVGNNINVFPSSSKYAGALVFNAQKAYSEAGSGSGYDITYRGINAKKFHFQYTGSCITETKTIVLIVTETIP